MDFSDNSFRRSTLCPSTLFWKESSPTESPLKIGCFFFSGGSVTGCQVSCVAGLFCLADLFMCYLLTGKMASLVSLLQFTGTKLMSFRQSLYLNFVHFSLVGRRYLAPFPICLLWSLLPFIYFHDSALCILVTMVLIYVLNSLLLLFRTSYHSPGSLQHWSWWTPVCGQFMFPALHELGEEFLIFFWYN